MKNNVLKFSVIASVFLFMTGCSKDDGVDPVNESAEVKEVMLAAEIDSKIDVISDIVLKGFEDNESQVRVLRERFLPDCAVITLDLTTVTKNIVIDFGTEGCAIGDDHMIKGKITLSYDINLETMSFVIKYSFEDFYVDDIKFIGSETIELLKSNERENPQYTMNMDFVVVFADGTNAGRTGTKTREWIEGASTLAWEDNVFETTGSWETKFVNGTTHSTSITTPLRREASCRYIVSGVVELVRIDRTGTLNYGDGNCDNKAIFTNANGEETEIEL